MQEKKKVEQNHNVIALRRDCLNKLLQNGGMKRETMVCLLIMCWWIFYEKEQQQQQKETIHLSFFSHEGIGNEYDECENCVDWGSINGSSIKSYLHVL